MTDLGATGCKRVAEAGTKQLGSVAFTPLGGVGLKLPGGVRSKPSRCTGPEQFGSFSVETGQAVPVSARRGCLAALLLLSLLFGACPLPAEGAPREAAAIGETFRPTVQEVHVETWVSGLEVPWSLVFLPDGRALVSERPGRIRLIENGVLRAEPWATLNVHHRGEGGLMGLAVHPRFPQEPYVYAMMTVAVGSRVENRVVRLRDLGRRGQLDRVIVHGIPGGNFHNGGRLAFGPDGMLYVTTGEIFQGSWAQDLDSLAGKVLRLTPEGNIPPDNPFVGRPGRDEIFTYGHRNPQGLAWHPQTGHLFASEHGPSGERGWRGHDEINVLLSGSNYGWPEVIGAPADARFVDPLVYWEDGLPPAGMAFWRGELFVTSLRANALVRLIIERSAEGYRVRRIERWFATGPAAGVYGRLRDVVVGPDGALYVLTSNRDGRGRPQVGDDRILRITRR